MKKPISVNNCSYTVDIPDACPICHYYGDTQIVTNFEHPRTRNVQVILQCAAPECRSYFIGYYPPKTGPNPHKCLDLKPQKACIKSFPEAVQKISPQFIAIYKEAEEAKSLGLVQIAGPGYRKAFEYLIKDYAKSLAPDKAGEINNKFSANVVNDFIPDKRIQSIAKRTLWLANDESHYLKKWADHDIEDLIALIRLTADWIDIEQVSKRYCEEMPEKELPNKSV